MKRIFSVLFGLMIIFSTHANASQFAACHTSSYDACPNVVMWSCPRYAIYGKSFEAFDNNDDYYAYRLVTRGSKKRANEALQKLIAEGVCPNALGNLPRMPIDQKWADEAERSSKRIIKKMRRIF